MLVLTRKPSQSIILPDLDIQFELVRIQGNTARIAVKAPKKVQIFREELLPENWKETPSPQVDSHSAAHYLCNRLSKLTLSLGILERLLKSNQQEEALKVVDKLFDILEPMDREWVNNQFGKQEDLPARRCRTLVVDDDPNERELLAGLLSMNGCDCTTVPDGQDALEWLSTHEQPDFILLDMWMPRVDGRQTIQAIRSNPNYSRVKVFSISSTAPEQMGIVKGKTGVDDWFPKPLNPRRLWDAIQGALLETPSTN